mmetsp:Transcript_41074/g.109561  ORF Transcript_41074/g.109561 Transcript_41074/m.109561 type:complete len:233 (+) Transcript_41074:123-821(+)
MIRIPLLVVGLGLASAFAPQRPNAIAPQRSLSADRRVRKLAATSPSFFDKQMTEATTELSWGDAYAARRFKPLDTRASASTFPTTIEPLQSAEWGALALPRVTSVSMGELNTFTAGFMGWDQSGAATATIPAAADAQRHMLESIAGGHHDPAHLRPLPKKLAIAAPESALGARKNRSLMLMTRLVVRRVLRVVFGRARVGPYKTRSWAWEALRTGRKSVTSSRALRLPTGAF